MALESLSPITRKRLRSDKFLYPWLKPLLEASDFDSLSYIEVVLTHKPWADERNFDRVVRNILDFFEGVHSDEKIRVVSWLLRDKRELTCNGYVVSPSPGYTLANLESYPLTILCVTSYGTVLETEPFDVERVLERFLDDDEALWILDETTKRYASHFQETILYPGDDPAGFVRGLKRGKVYVLGSWWTNTDLLPFTGFVHYVKNDSFCVDNFRCFTLDDKFTVIGHTSSESNFLAARMNQHAVFSQSAVDVVFPRLVGDFLNHGTGPQSATFKLFGSVAPVVTCVHTSPVPEPTWSWMDLNDVAKSVKGGDTPVKVVDNVYCHLVHKVLNFRVFLPVVYLEDLPKELARLGVLAHSLAEACGEEVLANEIHVAFGTVLSREEGDLYRYAKAVPKMPCKFVLDADFKGRLVGYMG